MIDTKKQAICITLSCALNGLLAMNANAHGDFLYMPQATLTSSIYASWQTQDHIQNDDWNIPGILRNEAMHASEEGLSLNDATLGFVWANESGFFTNTELGAHEHSSDVETEIEQAFFGYHWTHTSGHIKLEAGKMKGAFSLQNGQHPNERAFTEPTLSALTALEGTYSDIGLRAQFMNWHGAQGLSTYGIEIWDGENYPGSDHSDQPAFDLFARYQHTVERLQATVGIWGLFTDVKRRRDNIPDDHIHSSGTVRTPTLFTGDETLYGLESIIKWQQSSELSYQLEIFALQRHSDGELSDATRVSSLDASMRGGNINVSIQYQKHNLSIGYEELSTDNGLSGPGAPILGEQAGLQHANHTSPRASLSYSYSIQEGLMIRVEYIDDQTTQNAQDFARLALYWGDQYAL